jgi:hypothetical protein
VLGEGGGVGDNSTDVKNKVFSSLLFVLHLGGGWGGCKATFVGTLDNGPIADTLGQRTSSVRTTSLLSLLHLSI